MPRTVLTLPQARKIVLHAAGLSKHGQFGKGKEAVFRLIDHLGFVQVDTNYVVERAHHHALAARVQDYQREWLDQLQDESRIFEFWTFAAGFIPMMDFRFSLPVKESLLSRRKPLTQAEANMMRKVLDRVSREGPLMARDFENDRVVKSRGWWDLRPSKLALEHLYLEGKLVSTRKDNFQKVYDLTDNVIPGDIDRRAPTREEFARHIIRRSLAALGVANVKDITFRGRYVKEIPVTAELDGLISDGEVCEVEVAGVKSPPLYMLSAYKRRKIVVAGDAFILSPFDPLTVYRSRLKTFFDFDYMVECFVPRPKRKYGYFSLPVLIGDKFVARMDAKAERKLGILIIHNLHVERLKLTGTMVSKVCDAIRAFAKFNQCGKIRVVKCNNRDLKKRVGEKS